MRLRPSGGCGCPEAILNLFCIHLGKLILGRGFHRWAPKLSLVSLRDSCNLCMNAAHDETNQSFGGDRLIDCRFLLVAPRAAEGPCHDELACMPHLHEGAHQKIRRS